MSEYRKTIGISLIDGREIEFFEPVETRSTVVVMPPECSICYSSPCRCRMKTLRRMIYPTKPVWERENLSSHPTQFSSR